MTGGLRPPADRELAKEAVVLPVGHRPLRQEADFFLDFNGGRKSDVSHDRGQADSGRNPSHLGLFDFERRESRRDDGEFPLLPGEKRPQDLKVVFRGRGETRERGFGERFAKGE